MYPKAENMQAKVICGKSASESHKNTHQGSIFPKFVCQEKIRRRTTFGKRRNSISLTFCHFKLALNCALCTKLVKSHSPNLCAIYQTLFAKKLLILWARTNVDEIDPWAEKQIKARKNLTCNGQVDSNPSESNDPVLFLDAKQVHDHQDDGDQDVDERQRVEELCGDKECCKEKRDKMFC